MWTAGKRHAVAPSRTELLYPVPGGRAERTAQRAGDRHPAWITSAAFLAGYVVVAGVITVLGLFLTNVLVDGGVGTWDRDISQWLADHRTAWINEVTRYATFVANTEPVVAIALVVTVWLAWRRRWPEAIFLMGGMLLEVTVFLTANFLVDRDRPAVPRLNDTPSTGSYPSGHVAASLVLWVSIALVVGILARHRVARVLAWVPAAVLPAVIALARVYRGMHFATDVIAGAVLGALVLVVAWAGARVWAAAADRQRAPNAIDTAPVVRDDPARRRVLS
jgi:membrane-associated phospholipid phosphatase